jgi:hypothetical protein
MGDEKMLSEDKAWKHINMSWMAEDFEYDGPPENIRSWVKFVARFCALVHLVSRKFSTGTHMFIEPFRRIIFTIFLRKTRKAGWMSFNGILSCIIGLEVRTFDLRIPELQL